MTYLPNPCSTLTCDSFLVQSIAELNFKLCSVYTALLSCFRNEKFSPFFSYFARYLTRHKCRRGEYDLHTIEVVLVFRPLCSLAKVDQGFMSGC